MLKKSIRVVLFCSILPLFSAGSMQYDTSKISERQKQDLQDIQSTGLETDDLFDTGYKIAPMEKVQLKALSRKEKIIWAVRMSEKYTFL